MKKKKQIPKTLPKFAPGGTTNFNENLNTTNSRSTDATKNIYNEKRANNNAGKYAAYGQVAMNMGTQLAANRELSGQDKQFADNQTINSGVDSIAGNALPWYGLAKGASNIGKSFISKDENGNITTNSGKAANEIMTADHQHMINDITNKNYTALGLDSMGLGKFARMASNLTGNSDKTTGGWGKFNQFVGINPDNQYAQGGMNMVPNAIPQYPNGGKIPKLKPRDFKAEKAHYEEQTRGANQADGSGISSTELGYRYAKLLDPSGITSATEIIKNFYNKDKQDPIDYLGLIRVPFVSQGMKPLSKLAKQGNKASVLINTITKTNDVAESFRAGGMMGDKYGNGGAVPREFANSEIEKQENVVDPNGNFLQANGPTHEKGGVPVALPGNSMIFSDRLKAPGTKKTFADLNKPNNTNKEDKILDSNKYGNISKHTAELMKLAKNKNSQALFNAQESLKQAKVQAYAKKMGITLPQESPEQGVQFPNGGTLPMYNIDPNPQYNINPNFNQLPKDTTYQGFNTNYNLAPQITPMPATNDSTIVKNRRVEYANGGMLPKYAWGDLTPEQQFLKTKFMGAEQNQHNLAFNQMTGNTNSGYNLSQGSAFLQNSYAPGVLGMNDSMNSPSNPSNHNAQSSYNPNTLPWNRTNDSNQGPNGVAEKSNFTPQQQQFQEHTISTGNKGVNTPPGAKPNWMGIAEKGLNFAAQNAGNLYNLSRYNKPEIERYERAKANYLDPTAAIRDANEQTRRAEYNVRGASGGNAGTYLSNRVGLNAQNIENKDRIRQQYANSNAQIGNQVNQFNTEIAMREVIANAQNRARNRSGKGEAIGSMGYNTANQIMDNKKGNMDQKTLQLMMKYYNTPEFQKYMKESGF